MQAIDLSDKFFIEFANSFSDVDWYYEYIDDTKSWSKAHIVYMKAVKRLQQLSERDLKKFLELKVPKVVRSMVIEDVRRK